MKKVKFKKALFGFKRRQVLAYVDQICMEYEQQLREQTLAHEQYQAQAQKELQQVSDSLENSRITCAEQEKQMGQLAEALASKEQAFAQLVNSANELSAQYQTATLQISALTQTLGQKDELLAGKEEIIASQGAQVAHLQQQVAHFEAEFAQLRDQAEQSAALVNCLNVMHNRNRNLIGQIARLETRLEEVTMGNAIKEHNQTVEQNKQMIHSTEQLFATLRKEIGDALDSISSKIESGNISESEDGNYYVDMANL